MTTAPLRILLVEHDPAHAEAVRRALQPANLQVKLRVVGSLREYHDAVATDPPDLALLDLNPPDGRAETVLSSPPEANAFPSVVLTSPGDETLALAAMQAGALDYWVKSAETFADLPHCVQRVLREWKLRMDRKRAERELHLQTQVLNQIQDRVSATDITERKRTEESLRQSELSFRTLTEQLPDLVWQKNQAGVYISCNNHYAEALGFTSDTIAGHRDEDFFPPELAAQYQTDDQRAMASGQAVETEEPGQFRGVVRWFHTRKVPVLDERGHCAGTIGIARDITRRRREEFLLQARLQLAEAAQSVSVDELLQLALDKAELLTGSCMGFFHFVDQDEEGLTLQTWSTNTLKEMCTAEGKGRHYPVSRAGVWAEGVSTKQPIIHNDYVGLTHKKGLPEGHAPVVRELVVPVLRGGLVVALMGAGNKSTDYTAEDVEAMEVVASMVTDLALRKKTQQEFEHFFQLVPDLACIVSAEGHFLRLNSEWERVLGYTQAELLAAPFLDFVHPEDREATLAEFQRERFGQRTTRFVNRYRTKHGEYRWLEWNATQITDGDRVFAVARDITEHKRAETDLAAARSAAETANQAKSQFLANMSHEIRSPMTAILGFSELLTLSDVPAPRQREFLGFIHSNGQALLALINDILDLSRIEADRLELERRDCSLQPLIQAVLSVVGVWAAEKKLQLEVLYQPPLPEQIRTDPARLRQILVNLLVNAVKFTEQGQVCLTVRCVREADGSPRMQFAVSDSGIGISAARIGELFQPFMQADPSMTRRYSGTGLGLAISKRLAQALGGDIQVTSELGRGSTFTLTIDPGPLPDPGTPPVSQGSPTVGEIMLSEGLLPTLQGRVLFAEDMPNLQLVVRQVLSNLNLDLETASDGYAACELAEKSEAEGRPYDLILMDIQMPRRNGYEATRWLRQRGWHGPIVALTAQAMIGDREKCLAAGCDDYLVKPISMKAFIGILTRYLSQTTTA
ncbi:MAG: PAS domain S-box protein [Planctomycetota bacterium]|nr:PAS domain S-box protein [Planctomycetota bacterium]